MVFYKKGTKSSIPIQREFFDIIGLNMQLRLNRTHIMGFVKIALKIGLLNYLNQFPFLF
jgi:hypothetical protein